MHYLPFSVHKYYASYRAANFVKKVPFLEFCTKKRQNIFVVGINLPWAHFTSSYGMMICRGHTFDIAFPIPIRFRFQMSAQWKWFVEKFRSKFIKSWRISDFSDDFETLDENFKVIRMGQIIRFYTRIIIGIGTDQADSTSRFWPHQNGIHGKSFFKSIINKIFIENLRYEKYTYILYYLKNKSTLAHTPPNRAYY